MCAVVTGLVACDGPRPSGTDPGEPPPIVSLGAGASMTFPSEVQGEEEVDGDRHAFRRDDGVVWSVQPLQRGTSGMAPPTLDAVAIALVHRVELDEVEGELTHRNCTFGGRAAQCIEGWQAGSDGVEFFVAERSSSSPSWSSGWRSRRGPEAQTSTRSPRVSRPTPALTRASEGLAVQLVASAHE
jgi:hypothetical protein